MHLPFVLLTDWETRKKNIVFQIETCKFLFWDDTTIFFLPLPPPSPRLLHWQNDSYRSAFLFAIQQFNGRPEKTCQYLLWDTHCAIPLGEETFGRVCCLNWEPVAGKCWMSLAQFRLVFLGNICGKLYRQKLLHISQWIHLSVEHNEHFS